MIEASFDFANTHHGAEHLESTVFLKGECPKNDEADCFQALQDISFDIDAAKRSHCQLVDAQLMWNSGLSFSQWHADLRPQANDSPMSASQPNVNKSCSALLRLEPLQCICKLNHHRHFSVRVCPPIPQTCLKACKIGNLALILRNPRHENWRFSESEGMGYYVSRFQIAGNWGQKYADKCRHDAAKFVSWIP